MLGWILWLGLEGCGNLPYDPGKDLDGDGFLAADNDCNDDDAAISPLQEELCDGIDNNCDGAVDENITTRWYPDLDGDGHGGDGETGVLRCDPPGGYAPLADDCDDSDPSVFPGAPDRCDGVDNNCDGTVEESQIFYQDADGDGFGNSAEIQEGCNLGAGYVVHPGDCDDSNQLIFPGAQEICDPADQDEDCDGVADDADPSVADAQTWYLDEDGDLFGTDSDAVISCEPQSAMRSGGSSNGQSFRYADDL